MGLSSCVQNLWPIWDEALPEKSAKKSRKTLESGMRYGIKEVGIKSLALF